MWYSLLTTGIIDDGEVGEVVVLPLGEPGGIPHVPVPHGGGFVRPLHAVPVNRGAMPPLPPEGAGPWVCLVFQQGQRWWCER